MAATSRHINWSPLQVASCMLASSSISHHIVGEVALMHYQATPTSNQEFSIEICVDDEEIFDAVDVLKSSRLFQNVPDHIDTQSCYEGIIAYNRLQALWTVSQPRNIILVPRMGFFNTGGPNKFPEKLQYYGTQLLGLSTEDMVRIPFADPHELFVALVNRRVDYHDQLAGFAARRLFNAGILNERWLTGLHRTWNTWHRRNYDLAMALVGRAGDAGEPGLATSPNVNNQDCNTAEEGGRVQKRRSWSKRSVKKRYGNSDIKKEP